MVFFIASNDLIKTNNGFIVLAFHRCTSKHNGLIMCSIDVRNKTLVNCGFHSCSSEPLFYVLSIDVRQQALALHMFSIDVLQKASVLIDVLLM